ncbi:MAG: FAD:protein FMN transferase [Muribaculaceae bacterium]
MNRRYFAIVLMIVVLVGAMVMMRNRKEYRGCAGVVWTTEYHITYESVEALDDSVQAVLARIDASASKYNSNSVISRINDNRDSVADDVVQRLYVKSREVWRASQGAYDPTVSPLANVWGYGLKTGEKPDSATIDSICSFVGLDRTELVGNVVKKQDSRTTFDFNSIAKGLACDEVGRMLERNGVENYLVEIGGEIACAGHNAKGEEWRVSIDAPVENVDSVIHESALVIALERGGVATSGNYRNYNVVDGKKTAHTINPQTGYPELTNLLSATIVAKDCITADAFATACMVMGVERTKALLGANEEIAVMLMYVGADEKIATWNNAAFFALIKR